MTSNPTPTPQPLTDAEVEECNALCKHATQGDWKVVDPGHGCKTAYKCVQIGDNEMYTTLEMLPEDARHIAQWSPVFAARAIARIRADGRRIKILEHEIDCMSSSLDAIGDMEGPCAKEARRVLKMLDDESDTLAALEDKTK